MACFINYIPTRLHTNNRETIPVFFIGEILYRRCSRERVNDPFGGISLVDLSVNRKGDPAGELLCKPGDVLFNMRPENGKGEILDEAIVTLQIMELNEDKQYQKTYEAKAKGGSGIDVCLLFLKHKKEECNYAHAAFEIYFNGQVTTFDNYKQTLKKNSLLITWCKTEISKMMLREQVWINWSKNN